MISFSFQHASQFDVPDSLIQWIKSAFESERVDLSQLDFIVCDDPFLLQLNKEFLQHDTFTDIITFPLKENPIVAEVYISLDRVLENAKKFNKTSENEFMRVCIHGVLHLCGFLDKTDKEKKHMRAMENKYLLKTTNIKFNIC